MSVFQHKTGFHKLLFQCNEHVEMNKFLCGLTCTWMTIIDSQFYIIVSLSFDVSLELNTNLVVACLYVYSSSTIYGDNRMMHCALLQLF